MEYIVKPSKWGPHIEIDGKMIFYDFVLDARMNAKDIPPTVTNPVITYHMWYSPKDLKSLTGDILAARSLDGLERVLEVAKEEALKRASNKEDKETIKANNPHITTEKHTRYFLLS